MDEQQGTTKIAVFHYSHVVKIGAASFWNIIVWNELTRGLLPVRLNCQVCLKIKCNFIQMTLLFLGWYVQFIYSKSRNRIIHYHLCLQNLKYSPFSQKQEHIINLALRCNMLLKVFLASFKSKCSAAQKAHISMEWRGASTSH